MRQAYAYGIRAILTTAALLVGYGLWIGGSSDRVPADFNPADVGYTAVDEDASLTLATWNLRWLDASGLGEVPRSEKDYEVLATYARDLDADVVAVQEIASQRALERIFNPKVYRFVLSHRIGEQRVGFVVKRGLEYTRHDDIIDLSRGGKYRYGVDIEISHRDRKLRLLAVHLASGCQRAPMQNDRGTDASNSPICTVLASQSEELSEWVREREREEADWVILGDFNRQPTLDDPFWSHLRQADRFIVPTDDRSPHCYDGKYPNHIDHFVLDGEIASWSDVGDIREITYSPSHRRTYGETLPDHCPLSLTLQFNPDSKDE